MPKRTADNGDSAEVWPESSQSFGFIGGRKRHTIQMKNFLERVNIESNYPSAGNADTVKVLGVSQFDVDFKTLGKNLKLQMTIQVKSQLTENERKIKQGPWLLVNLSCVETDLTEQPAFRVVCHLFVLSNEGSKLQLLHKNDYSWKDPKNITITSIEMDVAKLEALHDELLPGGALCIVCEMDCAMYDIISEPGDLSSAKKPSDHFPAPVASNESRSKRNTIDEGHLQNGREPDEAVVGGLDLLSSLKDPEFSDVTLELIKSSETSQTPTTAKKAATVSKQFRCHKVVLSAGSEVFAEMLREKSTRAGAKNSGSAVTASSSPTVLTIRDVDAVTMKKLLTIIYSGTIPNSQIDESLMKATQAYKVNWEPPAKV